MYYKNNCKYFHIHLIDQTLPSPSANMVRYMSFPTEGTFKMLIKYKY